MCQHGTKVGESTLTTLGFEVDYAAHTAVRCTCLIAAAPAKAPPRRRGADICRIANERLLWSVTGFGACYFSFERDRVTFGLFAHRHDLYVSK